MGTLLDTTVLIEVERTALRRGDPAGGILQPWIENNLGAEEDLGIAAITASELLHGVHRAGPEHRGRREALVEAFLIAVPVMSFDLLCARAHASLWSHLAEGGRDIGAHDRIIAATAVALGWRVASANVRHFDRIPGLEVLRFTLPS